MHITIVNQACENERERTFEIDTLGYILLKGWDKNSVKTYRRCLPYAVTIL